MVRGYREATNPLYHIVVLATALWVVFLLAVPFVNGAGFLYEYFLAVFAIWAVLPVAMAFDVGILRQRFAVPARITVPLIFLSALPVVAPLAGGAYVAYRARIVAPAV